MSVSGEWFHNDAKSPWERNNVLRPGTYANGVVTNPSYRPITIFSPVDGSPLTVYDTVSAAVAQAVKNVDTNDTNVKQSYNAFEFNFQARLPHVEVLTHLEPLEDPKSWDDPDNPLGGQGDHDMSGSRG